MKLRSLVGFGLVLVSVALVAPLTLSACGHSSRQRGDWRGPPAQPIPCASDADCRGVTCAIEPGATQGTCAGTPAPQPSDPHDPNAPPEVNVQPAPTDIKL